MLSVVVLARWTRAAKLLRQGRSGVGLVIPVGHWLFPWGCTTCYPFATPTLQGVPGSLVVRTIRGVGKEFVLHGCSR